jgi:hypothetical protein
MPIGNAREESGSSATSETPTATARRIATPLRERRHNGSRNYRNCKTNAATPDWPSQYACHERLSMIGDRPDMSNVAAAALEKLAT